MIEAVARFGQILRQHAMTYLTKPTWREVLSASVQEGSRNFGRTYVDYDRVLIGIMETLVKDFQSRGAIGQTIDTMALADTLFSLQNMRFFQFIADDEISDQEIGEKFYADLQALSGTFVK